MIITDLLDENKLNYNQDIKIDIHNLHEEWLRQPGLCGDYNKLVAQTEKDRDKQKEKISILKAELEKAKAKLELQIRADPEKYNPPKNKKGESDIKEGWISSTILVEFDDDEDCSGISNQLQLEQNNLIDTNFKLNCYYAAVKAISDKKTSLEHIVALLFKNYFTVPNLPKILKEDFQNPLSEKNDDIVSKVREEINIQNTPVKRTRRI